MSKITRRSFLTASGSAIGAVVLAACGAGTTSTGGASTPIAADASTPVPADAAPQAAVTTAPVVSAGQTKVVFWSSWGGNNGEGVQKLVDDF